MTSRKYLPPRDADLAAWAGAFAAAVVASPAAYGLTPPQVASLPGRVTGFTSALEAATEPATRTAVAVAAKRTARAALESEIRTLVHAIRAAAPPDAALTSLGLPVYPPRTSRRTPPPPFPPTLSLTQLAPGRHRLRLLPPPHTAPGTRALPDEAAGAVLFYAPTPPLAHAHAPTRPTATDASRTTSDASRTATAPPLLTPAPDPTPRTPTEAQVGGFVPADDELTFAGMTTRPTAEITYPAHLRGKRVAVYARWYNRKGQLGPLSLPLFATVAA